MNVGELYIEKVDNTNNWFQFNDINFVIQFGKIHTCICLQIYKTEHVLFKIKNTSKDSLKLFYDRITVK